MRLESIQLPFLAQNGAAAAIVWSLLLFVFILVAFVAVVWVKKRVMSSEEEAPSVGFSLTDLRQLRKSGQMSEEEFEKAKTKILAAMANAKEVLTPEQKAAAAAARAETQRRRGASDNAGSA